MGTNVYQGRTSVSELQELIRRLGGPPKGNTKAVLQDQLEELIGTGGMTPDDIRSIVTDVVTEQLPAVIDGAIQTGGLTDDELDALFPEG